MNSKDEQPTVLASLGRNLRRLREVRAHSLAALSKRSGITTQRLAGFEQDRCRDLARDRDANPDRLGVLWEIAFGQGETVAGQSTRFLNVDEFG